MKTDNIKICVIGLGYVGLPLARLFSTKFSTIGYDMNQSRVDALMNGHDATLEVSDELLRTAINNNGFICTTNLDEIRSCNFYVVAVPTPVDENNRPDLKPLWSASETVGKVLSKGDIVVYESTVYPGVTEEECLPIVEKVSGLRFNEDFFAGYSPERINPGDKLHTVEKIKRSLQAVRRKLLTSLIMCIIPCLLMERTRLQVLKLPKHQKLSRTLNEMLI
jgi:UDP-N-acetyl-D-galactosamine dehydrogenase